MSVDITIKQKSENKKTLPLEIILGKDLHFGALDVNFCLHAGQRAEKEILVFNPQHIARGFSVLWSPEEKEQVTLRALTPTTNEEIRDFFHTVRRITDYWGDCVTLLDGEPETIGDLLAREGEVRSFNQMTLTELCELIVEEEMTRVLYATRWPLNIGVEEAKTILKDAEFFGKWLHEKQSMDVRFGAFEFYRTQNGPAGRVIISEEVPVIVPIRPSVPQGFMDPETGAQLDCKDFGVCFYSVVKQQLLAEVDYERFLGMAQEHGAKHYDCNHLLLPALKLEEIEEMLK